MARKRAFPRICIALGLPDAEKLLEHARREIEAGETFLEFRLDYLKDPSAGTAVIAAILREFPEGMILATCRRHQNHGQFNGSIDDEFRILSSAISEGACAVDFEIESAEAAPKFAAALREQAQLVVSYHNFENTPQVDPILKRLQKIPADAYKLVTTSRKPSDTARVLAAGRKGGRTPMILLAMGELGFPSRVLSPAFGAIFTYAAPIATQGTAAGQVCARHLHHLYRVEKLSRTTKIYGVIADPVRHSISPAVQNRAFQARRIDAVYLPLLIPPPQLRDFFTFAANMPLAGASVTIPHKQKVIRYLDVVEPLARRIGAVNTIWRKAGKWRGTNTDIDGVLVPLSKHLLLSRASVLIIGNGGAARGAACALADAGAKITITGRSMDRVRPLAKFCSGEAVASERLQGRHFDALVHATSVGMYPDSEKTFFDDEIPADVVFDMVYNPLETLLIRRAREQGKTVIPGIQMFVEQAVKQFEIWTGETAPRAIMQKAALEALQQKQVHS
jgi:3-dehydroquinate dehydratase / shikimate dehydrogenase